MTIELLYLEGCPHVGTTLDRLNAILKAHNVKCSIVQSMVGDDEAAVLCGFLGSPTVRINGMDIEPSARFRTDFGIMCRTYPGSGGVPSEALIRTALSEALEL